MKSLKDQSDVKSLLGREKSAGRGESTKPEELQDIKSLLCGRRAFCRQ